MSNYKYVKRYRQSQKARGKCISCSKDAVGTLCDEHTKKAREYQRKVREGFREYLKLQKQGAKENE